MLAQIFSLIVRLPTRIKITTIDKFSWIGEDKNRQSDLSGSNSGSGDRSDVAVFPILSAMTENHRDNRLYRWVAPVRLAV